MYGVNGDRRVPHFKVIGTDTEPGRPTYQFLLVVSSNYGLSRAVSQIYGNFGRKRKFFTPRVFDAPCTDEVSLGNFH